MRRSAAIPILVPRARPPGCLTVEEVAIEAHVHTGFVHRLVRLGVLDYADPRAGYLPASAPDAVRKVWRLRRDLGINLEGGAVILELLARIHRLEAELERMKRH